MKDTKYIVGVDIGGSHVTAGLVEMNEVKVVPSSIVRNKLNSKGTADEILGVWISTIQQVITKSTTCVEQIGFAMPGPFDYENGICLIKGFDKYESLYGMSIRQAIAETISMEPDNVRFRNDAEAFLAGELYGGAAKGYSHAIGVTLGTGLGTAISHDAVVTDAALSVTPYANSVMIEEFVSTRALLKFYFNLSGIELKDAETLAELCKTDMRAMEAFSLFADHLAWFLEKFIKQENPEVLVIGGNIANAWELFMNQVIETLKKKSEGLPDIVRAVLGEDASLVGGACCFQKLHNAVEQ